jgi:hypothetical protein
MLRLGHFVFLVAVLAAASPAASMERVVMKQAEGKLTLVGKIEVEAEDGGLLLLTRDGQLWPIPVEEIIERQTNERPFLSFKPDELADQKLAELPAGFKSYQTEHYVICYNTPLAYAQWVGALYERLYAGFFNFWKNRKWVLKEPEFPLAVVVFDSRDGYSAYARHELGDGVKTIIGYYSLKTNQVTMYDLTGAAGNAAQPAKINALLSAPGAERNVATIVHEATHQLAFNSGLQTRYADVPFWVSEGLAIYFETPDLTANKGWKAIGRVNQYNLANFRRAQRTRSPDALESLLVDDKRFRDARTAAEAYGEAWAFNYYLLRRHSDVYVKYLQALAKQPPLIDVTPEERRKLFQEHLGDLPNLEADFLRQMRNVN